ncbi:hypothetical protein FB451DRAFT_1401304 [Mycena latifolia]|nr:hypothetical protein FB451DRAFT_1401304 [Mycena latifolia]
MKVIVALLAVLAATIDIAQVHATPAEEARAPAPTPIHSCNIMRFTLAFLAVLAAAIAQVHATPSEEAAAAPEIVELHKFFFKGINDRRRF